MPFNPVQGGKTLLSWSFPEFIKHPRTKGWLIGASSIGAALLLYSFFTANFLFGMIVIIVAIILFIHHIYEPQKIIFFIKEQGIQLNTRYYPYKEMENFWIIYEPPEVKTLYFEFKGFRPRLHIPLVHQKPEEIKLYLRPNLSEDLKKENEPLSDGLGRILRL